MPQMAPLFWLALFFFFVFILFMFCLLNYFIKPFKTTLLPLNYLSTLEKSWKL